MTISHNLVMNVSAWFFWNTVNFVNFSVIHISQGSVANTVDKSVWGHCKFATDDVVTRFQTLTSYCTLIDCWASTVSGHELSRGVWNLDAFLVKLHTYCLVNDLIDDLILIRITFFNEF